MFRSYRWKRPPTRSPWQCSTTYCTGLTPRGEWCKQPTKSLVKTAMFSSNDPDNLLEWRWRTCLVIHLYTWMNLIRISKHLWQIIHALLQMSAEHPCETKGCSHLCVLAPGPKAVCKCPSGRLLSEDGLTCSSLVNSAFLLMLSPLAVTQVLKWCKC